MIMQDREIVLEVQDLKVDIQTGRGTLHAVRDVSFEVKRGETLCIVGESGCGKSMTSLSIMGLLPKVAKRSTSALKFLGEELGAASSARLNSLRGNKMAMIFQEPMTALNPAYTIGDQLTEHYRHHKKPPKPKRSRVRPNYSKKSASPRRLNDWDNTLINYPVDCANA